MKETRLTLLGKIKERERGRRRATDPKTGLFYLSVHKKEERYMRPDYSHLFKMMFYLHVSYMYTCVCASLCEWKMYLFFSLLFNISPHDAYIHIKLKITNKKSIFNMCMLSVCVCMKDIICVCEYIVSVDKAVSIR